LAMHHSPPSIRLPDQSLTDQVKIVLQRQPELTGIRPGTLAVLEIAQFVDPKNQNPSNAS
jgi:hypothetical protein